MKPVYMALLIVAMLLAPVTMALADQQVSVAITSGQTFQNTGWTTKSFTVDVSKIRDAKQITIHITGTPTDDPWLRYMVVAIDGQVVHAQSLDASHSWDNGALNAYSDVVSGQFEVRYDVTSLVKGKDTVTVKIGITTYTGSWSINANFDGVLEDTITIPTGGSTAGGSGNGVTVPVATASAVAGVAFLIAGVFMKRREEET